MDEGVSGLSMADFMSSILSKCSVRSHFTVGCVCEKYDAYDGRVLPSSSITKWAKSRASAASTSDGLFGSMTNDSTKPLRPIYRWLGCLTLFILLTERYEFVIIKSYPINAVRGWMMMMDGVGWDANLLIGLTHRLVCEWWRKQRVPIEWKPTAIQTPLLLVQPPIHHNDEQLHVYVTCVGTARDIAVFCVNDGI